jgi:pimeloyl-ACP methyl ester carboxylesterase/predicted glycosyltransferase
VRVFYEVYGAGEPAVLLLPTWEIVHSRAWKCQIPYLARHARVVAFDRRGSGRSDRPSAVSAYDRRETALDALAVLDTVGVAQAVVLSWCGGGDDLILAAEHPERVARLLLIAPDLLLTPDPADEQGGPFPFEGEPAGLEGWAKWNRRYLLRDWPGFVAFFFGEVFTEPHSTKQIEDAIGWGLDLDAQTIIRAADADWPNDPEPARELCGRVRCPTVVVQGSADAAVGPARGEAVARAIPGARLVTLEGCGHAPHLRDPVAMNLLIRDFACPPAPPPRWRRSLARGPRALYISSPIGLGHARRDVAIAGELRRLVPGLEVDWLAQPPVTEVLAACGERIHPASAGLASEAVHIESEARGHDLHVFEAWRRMDEILLANFMVFHDLVRDEPYDLWIGDEAWELDYFLHENPELKSAPYAWLTDFVGWLPMAAGGEREAFLTADYNAEMIEQIARFPRVRDRAIFVGDPADVVPGRFGPGLPEIREWTSEHYEFSGYVTGFDPAALGDRGELRARLGYGPDERVCLVTVGGSGVGRRLLERAIDALPEARRRVGELRMVAVAGPRIDPAALPAADGLEVRPYVHDLFMHLAACDLAIVQGGLTTAMELTAARRPFIYVPLERHCEQNLHVAHRLERHRAGRRMRFDAATPGALAAAIAEEIGREVDYRPVPADGAGRAAALIAELIA